MSYLVLARKWRPRGFDDLVGQEPIARVLKNSLVQGRIAHAYIFSGPRGVGKTSMARILARALNCEKGPTPEPCGACASCLAVSGGASMDVMEIDGASNNSVNDVRELRENVKYAPSAGRFKIYIIDESHMLSDSAFNALLKTLEEPPAHVVFVLATTDPKKIPMTVFSRCQHLPFRRITTQAIRERLGMISGAEGIKISADALELLARAADGSMRDSLTLLDQVASVSAEVEDSLVKELLGMTDYDALCALTSAVLSADRAAILSGIQGFAEKGADLRQLLRDLIRIIRDLMVFKYVQKPEEALDASEGEIARLRGLSAIAQEEQLLVLLSELLKAEPELKYSSAPRVALEMALMKASYFRMLQPVREAIEKLASMEETPAGPPASETPEAGKPSSYKSPFASETELPKISEPEAMPSESVKQAMPEQAKSEQTKSETAESEGEGEKPGNMTPVREVKELLDRAARKIPAVSTALRMARGSLEANTLKLEFGPEGQMYEEDLRTNLKAVEKEVSALFGSPLKVEYSIGAGSNGLSRRELFEKAASEPIVREALGLFDGRIADVKETKP
jgi:DNA polymerase-3 subunit gamma/tau